MEQIEAIADYGDLCGESPLWDVRNQTLYWSDITGRRVYRYVRSSNENELLQSGTEVAGLALLHGGGFAVTSSKIRNGAVTSSKIANSSITSADVKNGSLQASDFASGALPAGPFQSTGSLPRIVAMAR